MKTHDILCNFSTLDFHKSIGDVIAMLEKYRDRKGYDDVVLQQAYCEGIRNGFNVCGKRDMTEEEENRQKQTDDLTKKNQETKERRMYEQLKRKYG